MLVIASRRALPWVGLVGLAAALGLSLASLHRHSEPEITASRAGMVWIPGGEFTMGSTNSLARANERPAHRVRVRGFWMDRTPVTNAQFAAFVAATGFRTTAERRPTWASLKSQLPPGTARAAESSLVPGAMVFVGTAAPVEFNDYTRWWRYVSGAYWRHPQGPASSIDGKADHPVVQVSYDDALSFAKWVGKRLPTEAEWEFAARGRLHNATYAWGNEFAPRGQKMANIWDGASHAFPVVSKESRPPGTSRVCTYPTNAFDLCDVTGNVWQWVSDWYRDDAYTQASTVNITVDPQGPVVSHDTEEPNVPVNAPKRVIRGGSFLCGAEYCLSYRPSARRGNDPLSGMSHLGFRLVYPP